jgi:hypothetical protein
MIGSNMVKVTLKDKFGKENAYKFNIKFIKFTEENKELFD